jgi:hypothetical protein
VYENFCWLHYLIIIDDIRNPEIIKNTSTPIKPPGIAFGKAWNIKTDIIAMALKPSISDRYARC